MPIKFLLVATHHNFGSSQMAKAGYETTIKQSHKPGAAAPPEVLSALLSRASRDGRVSQGPMC